MRGDQFRQEEGVSLLREIEPDFLICVHFPYIVPKELLSIPVHGVLNLHPAYLPFNRGWHTPSWAIWDKTQYGATLHFMDEGLDTGDIVAQKGMSVRPDDTADKLYKRIFDLEYDLFKETWPLLMSGKYSRKPQALNRGTEHKKSDLSAIQQINLDERVGAGELIRRLKALTTNNVREAAYFTDNNIKYRIQINVQKEEENQL
jgi:methionyl-tRNA formyltransferase